jgi:hypothetical protein
MLKIITLIFAAVVAFTAIGTWAAANSHSRSHGKASLGSGHADRSARVMKVVLSNLPHQQYDAF